MTSKLAKSEILKMQKEGLKPTFEDIIKLNALGCKVEHGKEASEFTCLPRRAFLGDYILEEPSLYKRIFIDNCKELLEDNYYTWLFFMCWVLNIDDNELPKLDNIKTITDKIKDFKDKMLSFTERQIWTAIEYVFNGNDATQGEDFTQLTGEEKDQIEQVFEIPDCFKSVAQSLFCQLIESKLPVNCVHFTVPIVERMIYNALIKEGVDVVRNEQAQNCATFYACIGSIRTRLENEKKELR